MLDKDLAALYETETKAVKTRAKRICWTNTRKTKPLREYSDGHLIWEPSTSLLG